VELLLAAMHILPLGKDGARKASEVRKALPARGEDIGMADSLIAGICLSAGGMLLTRNHRHFARVEGLKLSLVRGGSEGADDEREVSMTREHSGLGARRSAQGPSVKPGRSGR
jgi:hypothetical protein